MAKGEKARRLPKASASSKAKRERVYAKAPLAAEVTRRAVPGALYIERYLSLKWAEANRITNEIVKAVRDALDTLGKGENAPAIAEWRALLLVAVYNRLLAGGDWSKEGANVLTVAGDMGTIAGLLSGSDTEPSDDQLKAAFLAVKFHSTCASAGIGGGAWCPFDWV